MPAMSQKRITTVTSSQPRCSKWWWMGAMRKMRRPVPVRRLVSLKQLTCSSTDSVSSTKSPPMTAMSSSVREVIARPARAPPRAREPTSPMMMRAGLAFHQRKPTQAALMAIESTARSRGSRTR